MARVKIHWSENVTRLSNISHTNLEHIDENGFYAKYLGKYRRSDNKVTEGRLLYIGQAYDQTIRQRLLQPHASDPCINGWQSRNPGFDIWVKAGVISETDQQRITNQLVDDTECCMINKNQPECNEQCMENYTGRDLEITHENAWIIRNSSCP